MPEFTRDTAILIRQFDLSGKAGVEALVWQPQQVDHHFDCHFQIAGMAGDKIRFSRGIDGFQALTIAIKMLALHLYDSEEYRTGDLTYLGSRDLDLPEMSGLKLGEDSTEKADILAHGQTSVVVMPGERFPRLALNGHDLNGLIETARAIERDTGYGPQRVEELAAGLDAHRGWYEEVSRRAGFTLPYTH